MEVGEPFGAVERAIEASGLPEEERAAVWLLAWSLGGGGEVHRIEAPGPSLSLASKDGV
jgi:hypothetical protein